MDKSNLLTLKIKYQCDDNLLPIINQYNSVLRYTYNRLMENPKLKTSEITTLQRSLNNVDLIGSHLKNSAIYDAKSLVSEKPIIFGSKHLFNQRCQHKISKEEFKLSRLRPLNCVGEACRKANRLFKIIDTQTIQFNLNRNQHYTLKLSNLCRKWKKRIRTTYQITK